MKLYRLAPICGVLLLAATSFGCKRLQARDQINKGVAAFRNAQYPQAIDHFQRAITFDPSLTMARLYLATAYFQLYSPGGESADNKKIAEETINAFEDVLKNDPNNSNAISSIATIYYYMHQFDKAKELQQRRLTIPDDANNPEVYYWIGQLDWALVYPKTMQMRKDLNIANPKDPLKPDIFPPIPEKDRAKLAEQNGPLIDEGIKALQKAIELKPDYVEAIAYLNLMYRQKSDIEPDQATRDADIAKANELNGKANDIIKDRQAKAASGTK
jgi:tetratricopeptide (TPR) repeat protein